MEKVSIRRTELFDELWATSLSRTAQKYDVNLSNLRAACVASNIPLPAKRAEKPELPASTEYFVEIEKISHYNPKGEEATLTTKANTVCLLKILYEYTSPEHCLSMSEIRRLMRTKYGLEVDRRTVTSSLQVLESAGWDVSGYDREGKGYCLMSRQFELSEVRLLMDSVYSNPAVPKKQTENLINELQMLLPVHQRRPYKHLLVPDRVRKFDNKEIFLNIEILDEAITEKKVVRFTYCRYDMKGKLIERRNRRYYASPLALYAANGFYYLLCMTTGFDNIAPYRLDKIRDAEKTDRRALDPPEGFRPEEFANSGVLMYGGEVVTAKLLCKNEALDYMIDTFGRDVKMTDNGDGTFNMTVTGSFLGLKLWAVHYLDRVKVLAPPTLRDAVVEMIKNNMYGV